MQATATSERLTAGFPTSLSAGKRGRPKKLVGEGFLRWSSAAPAVAQSILNTVQADDVGISGFRAGALERCKWS